MKVVLTNSARLPLKVCRGGEIKRNKLAEIYNQMLFDELFSYGETNCPVKAFKKALDKIIGKYKIKYTIENINDSKYHEAIAALSKITSIKTTPTTITPITLFIEGFNFHLPVNNNKISSKSSALHEARHFFDHICNPKTTTLHACKLDSASKLPDTKFKIHSYFLDSIDENLDLGILEQAVNIHLMGTPDKFVVDTLQEIRHSLKSEINAYTDEIKFLTKSKANISAINETRKFLKSSKYKEKLKLTNKMLKDKLIEMWFKRAGDVPTSPSK